MTAALIFDSDGQDIKPFKAGYNENSLSKLSLLIKGMIILLFIMFQICGCAGPESDDPADEAGKNKDIAGQWKGTTTVSNRSEYQTTFDFTLDGGNIGGIWDAVSKNETHHSEDVSGTLEDSTVTISVVVRDAENSDNYLEFAYSGKVDDSNISGDVTIKGDWNEENIDDQGSFTLARQGDDSDSNSGSPRNTIEVTNDIEQPTTWESQNVYVISASIDIERPLTIQAGTVIKFQSDEYLFVQGEGIIVAQGALNRPIVFTSYRDDEHSGDTNGDGNVTSPDYGDWYGIIISGTQGSVFNYCHFLYGGVSTVNDGVLDFRDSQATISNCVFAHNSGKDPNRDYYGALDATEARSGTVISSNRFYDNYIPLSINDNFDLDDSNIFQNESGTITNTYNAVFCNSNIDSNRSWGETDVAVVFSSYADIATDVTLSLANNVVLKFTNGNGFNIHGGDRGLINYNGEGVYFTSFRDDSLKGDSNGDGDVTTPADGDWRGIFTGNFGNYYTWPNILYDSFSSQE